MILQRHAFLLDIAELPQPENVVQPRDEGVVVEEQEETPQIPTSTEEGAVRAQEKEMRKRLWSEASQHFATINAKIKALTKMESPESLETLRHIVGELNTLSMHDISVTVAPLQPRFEIAGARSRLTTIRMYNEGQKKKARRRRTQSSDRIRVDPDEISYCSICFKTHPVLPDDMDPEEKKPELLNGFDATTPLARYGSMQHVAELSLEASASLARKGSTWLVWLTKNHCQKLPKRTVVL